MRTAEMFQYSFHKLILCFLALICIAPNSQASDERLAFFENKVRPLLATHCYECHSEDEQSGDVRLDSLEHLLANELVVVGKPEDSFLIEVLSDESYEMPPDGPLPKEKIETLARWIRMGAPWPGHDPQVPIRTGSLFDEEDLSWWAIAPLSNPELSDLPESILVRGGNEVDVFIQRHLDENDLSPAPAADPVTLIRRLTLDLTGLPPTTTQISEYLSDSSTNRYENLVDRLLASKGYGEHNARWWLDLVRYAESDGYRADEFRPTAYRYRDYVIEAFNNDKPYDRFVQEQLAADELFPNDLDAQVGLGYLRHWVYEWNIRDARTQWKTIMEDLTDTTADVFLGMGLQCAKCHNHKFDPLLQKDYFRLRGFFEAFIPKDVVLADSQATETYDTELANWNVKTQSIREKIAGIEQPYREKYRNIAIDRFPKDLQTIARKPDSEKTPHDKQLAYLVQRQVQAEYDRLDKYLSSDDKEKVIALRRELKQHESEKPSSLPSAMAVTDVGRLAPPTTMPKGRRKPIEPGIPSILDAAPLTIQNDASSQTTGRRSALAKWLTQNDNPLTTRVIANRVWQSHFGRGLASNPSDFGRLGGRPTHPELLDYLAIRLTREGWSLKKLHKLIVMSATYRQSTSHPDYHRQQNMDAANKFYWRGDTRRLSAEQIRDAMLLVSGRLKDRRGGASVPTDSDYRTVYTRVKRNSPDPLLNSFDLPQFFNSNSIRNTTTTPLQSLLLINSDQLLGYARSLARRLEKLGGNRNVQIDRAWEIVYGRKATDAERVAAGRFVDQQVAKLDPSSELETQSLIETSKLPYRDGQAVRMTLDDSRLRLAVRHDESLDVEDFSVEAFFEARSIANTGAVRTLISKWNGSHSESGWRFGVTGQGSRRKPQTLVLQIIQTMPDGSHREAAIFSDQHVNLNTPYYAGVSFMRAQPNQPGTATFYLKDLSNDDEVLSVAVKEHQVHGTLNNQRPLLIGCQGGKSPQPFDGLIDDVRLTSTTLSEEDILYSGEKSFEETVGLWRFETDDGVMSNGVNSDLPIQVSGSATINLNPEQTAMADLCHVLLNSNEFLYVH